MAEILLSFFAVIGILFLIVYSCDYAFYRNFKSDMTLIVDTRNKTVEQCIDAFELINSVRQMSSGKAVLNFILVVVNNENDDKAKLAREYMRVFQIRGSIRTAQEDNK